MFAKDNLVAPFFDVELRHCGDIASYEVLQEDDTATTNDILQGLDKECEIIHNKLFYLFRQQEKLKKAKQYQQLIYAAGRIYDACGAMLEQCIILNLIESFRKSSEI